MNCNDVKKFAYSYLDGEFDSRDRGEFEAHVAQCRPCHQAVGCDAAYRSVVREKLQRGMATADADGQWMGSGAARTGLDSRVRACLDRADRRTATRRLLVPATLAAGVVGIVIIGPSVVPGGDAQAGKIGGDRTAMGEAAGPKALPAATALAAGDGVPVQPRVRAAAAQVALAGLAAVRRAPGAGIPPVGTANGGSRRAPAGGRLPGADAFRLVAAQETAAPAEVLRGGLDPNAYAESGPFGAVRSDESLQAMVRLHSAHVPYEVTGPALRVQRYLAQRLPAVGPLPLGEGEGVRLLGARIAVVGSQPVVLYHYDAFGAPLTVFARTRACGEDADVERRAPDGAAAHGMLLDRHTGLHLLHVVGHDRVVTLVSELGAPALLQIAPGAD